MATSNRSDFETAHHRPRQVKTGPTSVSRVIGSVLVVLVAVFLSLATAIAMVYIAVGLPTGVLGLLLVWVIGAGVISASPTIADRLLGWLAERIPRLTT